MSERLLITSTDLMMVQFLVPHVKNLSEKGYDIDLACSNVGGRIDEVREKLKDYVKEIYVVRLERSPASINNFQGYKDLKTIINRKDYALIWTNEPVMGVMTRLAAKKARKTGTKVLYMVHGFHFYNGAPKKYWIAFFPVETLMGRFCDCVVTVNKEDYHRAISMKLPDVKYIHGIGINTDRLSNRENQKDIRAELQLERDSFIILSVGELNQNKNQATIIKAMGEISDSKVQYILCGKGDQLSALQELVSRLKLEKNVHFLGYRTDVVDICSQANVYVMPSHREGLPVSSLEAMYCGLPLVTSNIRGLVDIMEDGVTGYLVEPEDVSGFARAIVKMKNNPDFCRKAGEHNKEIVKPYCISNTKDEVLNLIKAVI